MFTLLINQGFSYIMFTLLYLSRWMTPYKRISKYHHLVNWNYPWKQEHYHRCLQYSKQAESLQTGKECEYEELHFRRGLPLACRVMDIACSSCLTCSHSLLLFFLVRVKNLQSGFLIYCILPEWRTKKHSQI